ncbi:MAG: hypothetical protein AAFY70_10730 [Bacteroidota bacterium]
MQNSMILLMLMLASLTSTAQEGKNGEGEIVSDYSFIQISEVSVGLSQDGESVRVKGKFTNTGAQPIRSMKVLVTFFRPNQQASEHRLLELGAIDPQATRALNEGFRFSEDLHRDYLNTYVRIFEVRI